MDGVPVLDALRNEEVPEHLLSILFDKERVTWEALDDLIKLTPDGMNLYDYASMCFHFMCTEYLYDYI